MRRHDTVETFHENSKIYQPVSQCFTYQNIADELVSSHWKAVTLPLSPHVKLCRDYAIDAKNFQLETSAIFSSRLIFVRVRVESNCAES